MISFSKLPKFLFYLDSYWNVSRMHKYKGVNKKLYRNMIFTSKCARLQLRVHKVHQPCYGSERLVLPATSNHVERCFSQEQTNAHIVIVFAFLMIWYINGFLFLLYFILMNSNMQTFRKDVSTFKIQ